MSKKKTQEWLSFVEDGQRWMLCKHCQSDYVKVDEGTAAITCSSCVIKKTLTLKPLDEFFAKKHKRTGRPAGWHFMKEFVDKDGNVFHKGKEQPELKGTLKPTKVKPPKKRKKLTKDEKLYKRISDYKKRKKARKKK
tara:strand:- start:1335 stop:1745 length:411 start_codon:yes stop_codon:yes gene_type:complete